MKTTYTRLIVLTFTIIFLKPFLYAQNPPDEIYTQNPFGGNLVLSSSFCLPYGSYYYEEDDYTEWYYNWSYVWRIEVPENTAIKIEYTKNTYDYFEIYTNNQNGYRQFVNDYSTGTKSVTVFSSDNYIWVKASTCYWGEPPTGNIFNMSFSEVSSFSMTNGSYNSGNTIVDGKLGIGTIAPQKKMEIWDGNMARFTFSGTNCTNSGYEVSQTIDNNGYKLNVGGFDKGYKVALQGNDVLKLLNNNNYSVGLYALSSNTTGYQNIAIGFYSMNKNITGLQNTAMGNYSLMSNESGSGNTAIGTHALRFSTTGNHNTAIGHSSLRNTTGNFNISVGSIALTENTTGFQNNAYGFGALSFNTTGSNNVGIGYYAGSNLLDGSNNTISNNSIFIGNNTKAQFNGQTNQIVIGNNAVGYGNNTVTIGNNDIIYTYLKGKVGIGTNNITTDALLTVNGIIHAKEVQVTLEGLADYVFSPDYSLMPLHKVEAFVKTNKHLPEIPSAAEVREKGMSMGEMQNKLLQKIEELTLYVIEQQKQIETQNAKIGELETKVKK